MSEDTEYVDLEVNFDLLVEWDGSLQDVRHLFDMFCSELKGREGVEIFPEKDADKELAVFCIRTPEVGTIFYWQLARHTVHVLGSDLAAGDRMLIDQGITRGLHIRKDDYNYFFREITDK